jgi:hypothetical protein
MNAIGQRRLLSETLFESRALCACLSGGGFSHIALAATGFGGWPCPVLHATGLPCPGCGLGRATVLLLRGHFADSFRVHAFAPLALLAVVLFFTATLLTDRHRFQFASCFGRLEGRWPFGSVFLWGLIIYWLLRFTLDAKGFIQLVT